MTTRSVRFHRFLPIAVCVVLAVAFAAAAPVPAEEGPQVTVMTQNLYVGANLAAAIGAIASGDPATIIAGVSEVYAKVQFTDFPARAAGIAREVDAVRPDLIGLQEAELWRSAPFVAAAPAHHVEYDFVDLLVKALKARGLHYEVVAEERGFDIQMPGFLSAADAAKGKISWIRLTDREVILARKSTGHSPLSLANAQTGHFVTNIEYPVSPDFTFVVQRGWASVDATIGGRTFRFVTTHLEADDEGIREAQAAEIVAGPASTALPVVFVADANSDGNPVPKFHPAAYEILIGGGFTDAWRVRHPGEPPVSTCCSAELLTNFDFPDPADDEGRIDLVLYRGAADFAPLEVDRLGTDPAIDRVFNGVALLWPSDHAGVFATLRLMP